MENIIENQEENKANELMKIIPKHKDKLFNRSM